MTKTIYVVWGRFSVHAVFNMPLAVCLTIENAYEYIEWIKKNDNPYVGLYCCHITKLETDEFAPWLEVGDWRVGKVIEQIEMEDL